MSEFERRGLFQARTVWTSILAAMVFLVVVVGSTVYGQGARKSKPAPPAPKDAASTLKIVKEELLKDGNFYYVKGSIYNPNDKAVKDVVISYYIWKKFLGKEGRGSIVKDAGGLVEAKIKYIAPKQTVEFSTDAGAPSYSDVQPDPLEAEIFAEWDK